MLDAMKRIESIDFAAKRLICSSAMSLLLSFEKDEVVDTLIEEVEEAQADFLDAGGGADRIYERIVEIINEGFDAKYYDPKDMYVAAYLFVLSKVDIGLFMIIIPLVYEKKECWWSRKVAAILEKGIRG